MSDLEKLAEHFDLKYGFQCYQIAIHRDEGYIDENNQPHTNHHAHMEFVTLNKENGKNMMRKAYLSPKKFADMQTEIAHILGMGRGVDKRISGTERIEPRKYAQMKEKERKELNTLKQDKTTLEKNSSNLALDLEKAQYQIKTLESNENTLKNDLNAKDKTINELKKQIQEQEYKYTQERERMKAENKRLQEQGLDKRYTQKDYENLKKQHADEIEALKKKIQEQNKYRIQANALRYRQAQQRKTMKTKKTTTPTPTPQPTYTPTKRM